jgi:hypothetical protein
MVVRLKHVEITDWDEESLKISMKTLASWSVHALRTRPCILSCLFKSFTHIVHRERDHMVIWNNRGFHARHGVVFLEAVLYSFGSSASLGMSRLGLRFVIHNRLQALPHTTSVGAGVIGFHLRFILSFCTFDVSSEVVACFLVCVHFYVLFLVSGSSSLLPIVDIAWFGFVRIVTVGMMSSMHTPPL